MSTTFPGSPRVLRGAIVGIDPLNPLASVIVFQYNPESLQRSFQPQAAATGGDGGDKSEALRLKGPPIETIKVDVEIDATDQLETGAGSARSVGIHPQLAALEMLLYPKSALVIANSVLMAVGTIEVIPPTAPLTIFIWGPKRVLPIRLTELSITEEQHDPSLNPIRAKASLGLRVLSYSDLPMTNPGYSMFLAHQIVLEAMAVVGSTSNLGDVVGADVRLF
ncbi:MAG TPA: hypothetical protein VI300_31450 [Solirubrobacter sp.]